MIEQSHEPTAPATEPERWHDHTCSACGATLGRGVETFFLGASRYEPMQPGPDWEAEGDWKEAPRALAGFVCAPCLGLIQKAALGYAVTFPREEGAVSSS